MASETPAPPAPERSREERLAPRLLAGAGAALLVSAAWAAVAGLRLGDYRGGARLEQERLQRIHAALEDAPFRSQLAAAVETLSKDAIPLPIRLRGIGQKLGIPADPFGNQEVALPAQGLKEISAAVKFKDISLSRLLDYARTVELEIPDAVLVEATLKPLKDAGDRWEAQIKIARRVKPAP